MMKIKRGAQGGNRKNKTKKLNPKAETGKTTFLTQLISKWLDEERLPAEVKWTSQLRPEELKHISLYKNGLGL